MNPSRPDLESVLLSHDAIDGEWRFHFSSELSMRFRALLAICVSGEAYYSFSSEVYEVDVVLLHIVPNSPH